MHIPKRGSKVNQDPNVRPKENSMFRLRFYSCCTRLCWELLLLGQCSVLPEAGLLPFKFTSLAVNTFPTTEQTKGTLSLGIFRKPWQCPMWKPKVKQIGNEKAKHKKPNNATQGWTFVCMLILAILANTAYTTIAIASWINMIKTDLMLKLRLSIT